MRPLITTCCLAGIREWVCCPGARNAAILQTLSQCTELKTWTHFDERSAAFFALGRIQASGCPVAVTTTSGTAAAELLPAVIEAYYQRRPLLIVTADRPAAYCGTGAPQSIEQTNLYGTYAPTIELAAPLSLPDMPDIAAMLAKGFPVHLNVRLPEPDLKAAPPGFDCTPADPPEPPPFRGNTADLCRMIRFHAYNGLVLLIGGLDPDEQEPVLWLAQTLRVPVIADATSGLREELEDYALHDGDSILRQNPPPYVLRVGDVPVGRFWRDLEDLPQCKVYSITRTGFSGLARESCTITGHMENIMPALGDLPHVGDVNNLRKHSRKREALIEELLLTYPESEAALTRTLSLRACLGDTVFLGNSSPVRLWNAYAQWHVPTTYVRANRGANGIDGLAATYLGNTVGSEQSWCFMGDLSALYDANAPAMLPQLPQGQRLVAIMNNQGGGIFRQLPHGSELTAEMERLLVQPHDISLHALAELWGARHITIRTADDFDQLDDLPEDTLVLAEILPDAEQTASFHQQLTASR
ncbi:2-succinyl-5-enolpyruvyl-6-hydroxy-3-cyclohexene-1-carboxylic-acid synthase [Akkermansia glycaniphila]|uniref:2-succinyl-5-enolpyruvyl-6-hydroxy-3-cyclohexene-1-carboxylate synthase n=1 Tax=Akkermansia glycaniphila TaxID=1679444 RepID=A0A1C7P981_9BACT|nr:2-succinyl-5-enolpyruvyl-6-hydroxy-3-cyclohexene-1-carboxylic-acid synthase [Akkermansia glycaniphila]OCA02100.1 hypothetical protein AC781_13020 [Akkermansia glycaniphila]SEH94215.1 mend: 2-succinyl-5-enolpyruvyl-6-hydroxy-3-cyclohexene-1-carboxylic-acid synthase [Akkermansia glycaniphila]